MDCMGAKINLAPMPREGFRITSTATCLAAMFALGCSGATTVAAAPAQAAISSEPPEKVKEYVHPIVDMHIPLDRLPEVPSLTVVAGQPDLNHDPINIFVYWNESAISRVRVLGHASEEVCRMATAAVLELSASPSVAGVSSYGVADLYPTNESQAFQSAASETVAALRQLADNNPELVVVHDVRDRENDELRGPGMPKPPPSASRLAFAGYRGVEAGPAFVPLRRMVNDRIEEVSFEVSVKDFGISVTLLSKLASAYTLSPYVEQVERARLINEQLDALASLKQTARNLDDGKWRYSHGPSSYWAERGFEEAATVVGAAIASQTLLLRKYRALNIFGKIRGETLIDDADVAEVERELAYNQACLVRLNAFSHCEADLSIGMPGDAAYFDCSLQTGGASADQLDEWMREFADYPANELADFRHKARLDLTVAAKALATAEEKNVKLSALNEAAIVDAMLRGWPISTDSAPDAKVIDKAIRESVPELWKAVRVTLQAATTHEIDWSGVSGPMQHANVFFRVKPARSGKGFTVTPIYVVLGPYMEVWDFDTKLIIPETPFDVDG